MNDSKISRGYHVGPLDLTSRFIRPMSANALLIDKICAEEEHRISEKLKLKALRREKSKTMEKLPSAAPHRKASASSSPGIRGDRSISDIGSEARDIFEEFDGFDLKPDGMLPSRSSRPLSGKDRPMSGNSRPLSGNNRPHSGNNRPLSGSIRPLSGKVHADSAKDRTVRDRPKSGSSTDSNNGVEVQGSLKQIKISPKSISRTNIATPKKKGLNKLQSFDSISKSSKIDSVSKSKSFNDAKPSLSHEENEALRKIEEKKQKIAQRQQQIERKEQQMLWLHIITHLSRSK